MARDVFQMTLSSRYPLIDMPAPTPDVEDVLQALEAIQVSVFKRGTTNLVDAIYQRPTGATQGPTPESGATGGPNPFMTGPSGNVEFWVDGPAEVDVFIHDTIVPARISDRTFGWNATAVGPASLPTSMLAQDGGLALASLSAEIKRQLCQIGQVIDWWRPAATVPLPDGFVICEGQSIPAGSHDFPVAGAINVPDLRNRFILGADQTKAQATGANQGNASGDAPGVAGTGGSNAAKDLSHAHGVPTPSHTHTTYTPNHGHSVGSLYFGDHAHYISLGTGTEYQGALGRQTGGGTCCQSGHTHPVSGWSGGANSSAIGGAAGGADSLPGQTSGPPSVSLATVTNSLTWTADPGTDMRPRFYGLLKLMKVKYS